MNFLDYLNQAATTAGQVYGSLKAQPTVTAQPAPVAKTDWQQYLPWAIGGLVALVALGLITRR